MLASFAQKNLTLAICITASGLVGLVQPMLWDYTPDLDVDKTGRNPIQQTLVCEHSSTFSLSVVMYIV